MFSIEFLITSFVVVLIPGTGVLIRYRQGSGLAETAVPTGKAAALARQLVQ